MMYLKAKKEDLQEILIMKNGVKQRVINENLPIWKDGYPLDEMIVSDIKNEEGRVIEFEEKPIVTQNDTISIGVYIIRRRQLIDLLEKSMEEERFDFVKDILIRYKGLKKIYAYEMEGY